MNDTVVFTFGRFNPITYGHEKVIKEVASVADWIEAEPMVFVSQSHKDKNPLDYHTKINYMRKFFPQAMIIEDTDINNPFDALRVLSDAGYKRVVMIVGSDRVETFENSIRPYIGHPDPTKSYDFAEFIIHSAGEREGSISGTQMREFAEKGDFISFYNGMPSTATYNDAIKMYQDVIEGIKKFK